LKSRVLVLSCLVSADLVPTQAMSVLTFK